MITFSPRRITTFLLCGVSLLTLTNIVLQYLHIYEGKSLRGLVWVFDVSHEINVPTWYSSIMLFCAAGLLLLIALVCTYRRTPYAWHWKILASLFLLLSVDESASLHEWTANLFTFQLFGGFFYYQWVVFGLLFAGVFVLVYLRFFFALPTAMRWLFFLAGAIFIGGALGMEMVSARYEFLYQNDSQDYAMTYALITSVEEALEMSGVVIFIYALLVYLRSLTGEIRLHIAGAGEHRKPCPDR